MALKDWYMKRKQKEWVMWEKKKSPDEYVTIGFYYATSPYVGGGWLFDGYKKYRLKGQKWFKTKKQALSFAKSYMRSH